MSNNTSDSIKHHVTHAGVDILAGVLIGVFYKPKTATGFALKGAIAGIVVYHLLNDPKKETTNSESLHP